MIHLVVLLYRAPLKLPPTMLLDSPTHVSTGVGWDTYMGSPQIDYRLIDY